MADITDYKIEQLAMAIAKAEGFFKPNSLPAKAHNPGDLERGDLGLGTIAGKTIFADDDSGWDYLRNQCLLMLTGKSRDYKPDMTFSTIGVIYATPDGGSDWARNVATALGLDVTNTLNDFLAQPEPTEGQPA